ncbi:MAG TPA: hypothetical protein VNN10_06145 [Dehalococcoidia bacterium]|nr:hypothetical protein [Dehalococcoidia bacterium]
MASVAQPERKLRSFQISAVNSAADSKGSIHDDEKAREMGYEGGFVPGPTVLGYMSRLMRETFGRNWLSDATFSGRVRRPVYEGTMVTVEGQVVEGPDELGRVVVELRVVSPTKEVLAEAQASCNSR